MGYSEAAAAIGINVPSASATPAAPGSAAPTETPTACCREELNVVAAELNSRPRETLGRETPAERLSELLAA